MKNNSKIELARNIIRKKPHLIWYSKNYDGFTEKTIFEHVLNYGEWDDVQELVRIYGYDKCYKIFQELTKELRQNLYPQVKHFYNLYFSSHVS